VNWQPNCVVPISTKELFSDVPEQIKVFAREVIQQGWRFFVVKQDRGRCYYDSGTITIPLWVINNPKPGKKFWYIAHELAHVYTKGDNHGSKFMAKLKEICPKEYQHFELNYKPRAAFAAGIRQDFSDI
jgi:predicted metal-dependent hydrolase